MDFIDRFEAGRLLAAELAHLRGQHPVVLALPRGGVPIGFEVARALQAPLDLVLVRKIGAPGQPELAIGAVAEGDPPELVTEQRLLTALAVPSGYVEATKLQALDEIRRRRAVYLRDRPSVPLHARVAIVVDDGIATGATMLAALRAVRRQAPQRLVLAVPVAAPDSLRRLSRAADETVCLETPMEFSAVGQFYRAFPQLSDQEVTDLLDRAATFGAASPAARLPSVGAP
jgi:putative phosphoribosyl transferase